MISEIIQNYINCIQSVSNIEKKILNNEFNSNNISDLDFEARKNIIKKLTEEEHEILYLKKILYSMCELTLDENTEARKIINNKISEPITMPKKLELMIHIKQQIIGKRIRKFNIGKSSAKRISLDRLKPKSTILSIELLNDNTVQLTGCLNAILKPNNNVLKANHSILRPSYLIHDKNHRYYKDIAYDYTGCDEENQGYCNHGYWRITGDFKTLKWNHFSDKKWKDDESFSIINE